ncbi:GNAT family N-acetyltransferase [Frondihabitans australicus]|uniref:Beta-1,4-N-acetylglucosamine oligosaccharide N-acyltransferase NodA n=1 Tax=Frondihabitans australicus TaxID=386892 RepID=A0A495IL77_9MICO|nr:GNAT family N-acetyltransferase [Frondihabitans australicus]RKR76188.1 beta-1,4-N-acetylglucosamine oligosaccharide N-acyltransferase NodA [Frondihabitans australicus]
MTDPAPHEPIFTTVAEGRMALDDHEAVTAMLSRAFPTYSHWYQGARSWAGMQPEKRVIARSGDVVVAHAGLRRQFVTVGETEVVVASVGMVAVSPILQGTGLGAQLLALVDRAMSDLQVPFGLLETGEQTVPFYARHGWQLLPELTGTYNDFSADGGATLVTSQGGWLVKPVHTTIAAWPEGALHVNGQIV